MTERETLDRLREIIGCVSMIDPASISENAQLLGFGIDSIRVIELVMTIEDKFAIQLNPHDFINVTTVLDLVKHIENVRHGAPVLGETQRDY